MSGACQIPNRTTRPTPSSTRAVLKSLIPPSTSPSSPHLLPKIALMASRPAFAALLRARTAAASRTRAAPSLLAARRRGYATESEHSVSPDAAGPVSSTY